MFLTTFPLLATFVIAIVICAVFVFLSAYFGPKKPNPKKSQPFECGFDQYSEPRLRFSVKFYVIAMLFIIFDIEVVFLYPWAVEFLRLGWAGFWGMLVFILVLLVGLIYAWRRGALEWD